MSTVSTYLKMMDQFSRPLQRVSNGVQTAIETMGRLKRVAETPVTVSVDTSKAVDSINQTKAQLENTGGTSAIQIAINSQTIAQELNNVRQRVQSGLSSAAVQVALDAQPAMQATTEAREQIAAALGTIEVAARLDIPTQLPMIQPQAVEVPVQLDQAGAAAQWQSFRGEVLREGLPTLTLEIDAEKAVTSIERAREKIGKSGSTAIELALNAQDIVRKVADVKQRIVSELSQAIVHVTLDKQQALTEAANLRMQINDTVGQIDLHPKFELPQASEVGSRLSRMLDGVSPTITAKLAFDPHAAFTEINRAIAHLESISVTLKAAVDASGVTADVDRIKQQIASVDSLAIRISIESDIDKATKAIEQFHAKIGGSSVIELALNVQDILAKVSDLKQRIKSELSEALIHVTLDKQQVLTDAASISTEIARAVEQVELKLAFEPNAAYEQIHQVTRQLQSVPAGLQVTMDAKGAVAEIERLKQLIESIGSPEVLQLSVQLDTENTMQAIDRIREKINSSGSSVIELVLNVQDILAKVADIKDRIKSELSEALVHITLDKQQALADAANIRADIAHEIGLIEIKPIVEISQMQVEKLIALEAQLRAAIEDATKAQERFNEQVSAPLPSPEIPQPVIPPTPAPTWEAWTAPEIFQSSGVERYAQEIEDLQAKMSNLSTVQKTLDLSDTSFLPGGAAEDISALQQRLQNLGTMLQKVESQKDSLSSSADPEAFESLNASAEKIRGSIQQAVDQQDALNKAMKAGDLSGVQQAYSNLNQVIDNTEGEIRNNTKEQERFNKSVENGEKAANGLLGKILGFVGAYAGVKTIKDFFQAGKAAASEQLGVEQRLQTIMGNINGITQDGIDMVKERARELEKTPIAISASVGMAGQSQLAEYVYDPTNIAGMTESMYNLATETYGVGVSMEQMQQTANLMGKVMMGDINALSRNGFKIDAIFTEAEQKLLKTGTEAERAAMVIAMIDENLSGLAEAMGNTPEGQALRLARAWGAVEEKIGYGIMPLISEFSTFLTDNMSTIEDIVTKVFGNLIDLLTEAMQLGMDVGTYLVDNWSWIEPIIWGVVAAITAYTVATKAYAIQQAIATAATTKGTLAFAAKTLVTKGLTAAWKSLNAAMKANIFILIISLLIALGVWLYNLWQKNDNFAAGLMRAWNAILNFFDQVPIFFVKVGLGIVNALFDMRAESLKIMDGLINGIIDGINWLINKSNTLLGTSFDILDHVNLAATAELEAKLVRKAGNDVIADMQANAADKAAEREQKVLDMLEDRAAKREREKKENDEKFKPPPVQGNAGTGAWDVGDGRLPDIGKVKQVDKIKDTVDISSEDLKMMRELAEMKNIQNFVTLQPSISFGDTHVQRESDINTIVARITDKLNEDIATSVDAVYT